jgi:hypothetical protein
VGPGSRKRSDLAARDRLGEIALPLKRRARHYARGLTEES